MNNKIKTVVCLITVLALSVCWIKADEPQASETPEQSVKAEEQNNIDPNPLCTFLDSNGLNLMIWGAASNAENMDAPEKLRYWVNYSYIIYLPKDINGAVKEKDADTVTIDFLIAPTFDDDTREKALNKIKSLLPNDIQKKVTMEQIMPVTIKNATIKSSFVKAELNIQDDFLSSKYRSITISKKSFATFLAILKQGRGFSNVEITNFDDKKLKLSVLLKENLYILEGEAILENIEEAKVINQKEQRVLVSESNTSEQSVTQKESIEITVPEVIQFADGQIETQDMLINTNSVHITPIIKGNNDFVTTNAFYNIREFHFDKNLRKFTFDVEFFIPRAQIVEKRILLIFVKEKIIESKAELVLDISYDIFKEKEPDQTIKLTPDREGKLSSLYEAEKYALKQLKVVDEGGNVQYFKKNGDYGRIHIKNEPGKIDVQFK